MSWLRSTLAGTGLGSLRQLRGTWRSPRAFIRRLRGEAGVDPLFNGLYGAARVVIAPMPTGRDGKPSLNVDPNAR